MNEAVARIERAVYVRAIQGGGNGCGFKPPKAILINEAGEKEELPRAIIERSRQNLQRGSGSRMGLKVCVWNEALTRRLFELHRVGGSSNTFNSPSQRTNSGDADVVHIWRFGWEDSQGHPVMKFGSVEFRKSVIQGYSDFVWRE